MLSDKEQKKEFKAIASKDPDKYFATDSLKSEGFHRNECTKCGKYFWNVDSERKVCGDAACSGGFDIADGTPAKNSMTYVEVWKNIVKMFDPLGYTAVDRYPVVARWNPTTEFVMASIAAFQPYVVIGEVDPPAKQLVIPQFSLRFSDIDNVGVTGSHCTGFVMIGQHAFVSEKEWDQDKYFMDIYNFLVQGVGLDKKELTMHEDAWAGGGSFGPCMEFFSRGIELFNQVYTMFEQTPKGNVPLKLKVLDMGLGMERVAWFSQGTSNMYEAIFPQVLAKLRDRTGVQLDPNLYRKFSKYSAFLNTDETEDIDGEWKKVAEKVGLSVTELKEKILPNVAVYSIAEHTRTLLVALTDGALPANVGGGYNLRTITRRALSFIDEFGWDIKLSEVCKWHADELKDLFPELSEKLDGIKDIFANELEKFNATKQKAKAVVTKYLQKDITVKDLLDMYDANGISPDIVVAEAKKVGKVVEVPDNFYGLVTDLHEKKEQIHATKKEVDIDLSSIPITKARYFNDYSKKELESKVLFVDGEHVILDETRFYPTSGGQLHDIGTINGKDVTNVIKQDNIIIHFVPGNDFKVGDTVVGQIDEARRKQLTQLHSSAHIVNAASRKILGSHINQAGAKKVLDKASLDVTHYKAISDEELKQIEDYANEIVDAKVDMRREFMSRRKAEDQYGMDIYQGGAIPGNELRIVEIPGYDVECCAGTHLNNTSEIGHLTITKSTKISDGIVRIEFVAGEAEKKILQKSDDVSGKLEEILGVEKEMFPARVSEIFKVWKKAKKAAKKKKELSEDDYKLKSVEKFQGDALVEAAKILKTQVEHLPNTVQRFLADIEKFKKRS